MFGELKQTFDPRSVMNPGVIVDPLPIDVRLRLDGPAKDRNLLTVFSYPDDHGSFAQAQRRCVGVGKCRQSSGGVMCPSYQVTRQEQHSTRGRAHLLWEMLQGEVITDGWRSAVVGDALDLCLSCKGCLSDCPVNVDMASYKGGVHPPALRRPAVGKAPLALVDGLATGVGQGGVQGAAADQRHHRIAGGGSA